MQFEQEQWHVRTRGGGGTMTLVKLVK